MKLRTKLTLGFAAVIFIVISLGATAYVMFKRVDSNVDILAERALPELRNAAAIKESALKTLVFEKEYLLNKTDEAQKQTREEVKTLIAHIGNLSQLAQKVSDTDLSSQAAEVQKLFDEYAQLYEQTVAALQKNRKEEQRMDEKGATVRGIVNELMNAKKAEYIDAKNALAIINNVNAWVLEIRLNEKSYLIEQKQQFINGIKRNMQSLLKAFDELDKLNPTETEKKQVNNARNAIQDYNKAVLAWAEELKRDAQSENLQQYLTIMNRAGDTVSQVVEDYTMIKQGAVDKTTESVFIVREIGEISLMAQLDEKTYLISRDSKHWESLTKSIEKLAPLYQRLKGVVVSPQDLQRIEQASKATDEYLTAGKSLILNDNEVTGMLPRMKKNGEMVLAATQKVQKDAWDEFDGVKTSTQSIVTSSNLVIAIALGVGILVGSLLAFFITRSITKPIHIVIDGLEAGASQVSGAAGQISLAATSLSEGTSEQAAAVEETSSSLEQMASMTKQNAENASQANRLMIEASRIVAEANESFGHLTQSMGEISRASEETQKIIKTIDEIAFQTNLLALNAAVEAARAGEAGAGFAVVADEVRNLALRAAEASRNTEGLIEETVKRVKDGSTLLSKTGQDFERVSSSVAKSAELVGEIAAASSEQAQGIDQINRAVAEMDKVIQRNAASAEESAAASEEMNAQAEQMKEHVGKLVEMVGTGDAGKDHKEEQVFLPPGSQGLKQLAHSQDALGRVTWRKKESGRGSHKALSPGASDPYATKPERVIPLDEDF
jgi:methyl-accepting chemotaxis protein